MFSHNELLLLSEEKASFLRYGNFQPEQCSAIYHKGYDLYQSPRCAFVKALLDGVSLQDIIFTSSSNQVEGVCRTGRRRGNDCVGQLNSMIRKAERMGCNTDEIDISEGNVYTVISLEQYKEFSDDISNLQRYLCTDDCFEESKLFYEPGDVSNMSCVCLIGAHHLSNDLSADGKSFIGMDEEVDSMVNSAIGSKQCKMSLKNSLEEA